MTSIARGTTSLPMPSPGTTAMRFLLVTSWNDKQSNRQLATKVVAQPLLLVVGANKSRLRGACLEQKLKSNYFRKRRRAIPTAPIKPEPKSKRDDGSGAELNEKPASPFGPKLPIWMVSLTVPSDSNMTQVTTPLKFQTKPGAFQYPMGSGGSPFSQTPFAQAGSTQMFAVRNGGFVQPGQGVQPAPPTQIESKATWSLVSAPNPHGSKPASPS